MWVLAIQEKRAAKEMEVVGAEEAYNILLIPQQPKFGPPGVTFANSIIKGFKDSGKIRMDFTENSQFFFGELKLLIENFNSPKKNCEFSVNYSLIKLNFPIFFTYFSLIFLDKNKFIHLLRIFDLNERMSDIMGQNLKHDAIVAPAVQRSRFFKLKLEVHQAITDTAYHEVANFVRQYHIALTIIGYDGTQVNSPCRDFRDPLANVRDDHQSS